MERGPCPPPLAENAERWTDSYATRKRLDRSYRFRWPDVSHEGTRTPVNRILLTDLLVTTAGHCAYCDGFVGVTSEETIDHFRPKSRDDFFHLAFAWENLFPACDKCQREKGDSFDDRLLKPDEATYDFDRYFDFNVKTGEVEPNRRSSPEDQARAHFTIVTFGLNVAARCMSRRREFHQSYRDAARLSESEIDDLPYRYLAPSTSPS